MSPNFLKLQRQQYLLIILGIVVIIGVIVVWFGYFRADTVVSVQINAAPAEPIRIDFSVFDDPIFLELGSPITDIPIPDAEKRANPFIATE